MQFNARICNLYILFIIHLYMRKISIFKLTASNKIFISLFIARPIYVEKFKKNS